MEGISRSFIAAITILIIVAFSIYFVVGTIFRDRIVLPKDIRSIEKKIERLERQNADEHKQMNDKIKKLINNQSHR